MGLGIKFSIVIILFHNGSVLNVHRGHWKENTRSDKPEGRYIIVILIVR